MKTCTQCKETKAFEMFGKLSASPDGHRPACKACSKAKRVYNREAGRAADKRRYAKEAERRKAYAAQYRKDNLIRCAANDGKKRAVRCGAIVPEGFKVETTFRFYEEARRLTAETGVKHEVDHIIPCDRGGLHCPSNLQVLTASENIAKSNH